MASNNNLELQEEIDRLTFDLALVNAKLELALKLIKQYQAIDVHRNQEACFRTFPNAGNFVQRADGTFH